MKTLTLWFYALFLLPIGFCAKAQDSEPIKIGLIGLDTSHATAFTKILNSGDVPGGKVVAGVPQSSPDIESSHTRIDNYVKILTEEWGVKMYDTIEAMLPHVDVVMVESVDGRPHLEQARPVIEAGKMLYVDKPMSASLKDVITMFDLAKKHNVPMWSSSNLRFNSGVVKAATADVGELTMAFSYGPASLEEHHLDLAWYGIHPVEALYTVMGIGCQSVQRTHTEGTDVVTGLWEGDKIGILQGIRKGKTMYGVKVFGTKGMVEEKAGGAYPEMMTEMIKFFKTGKPPVTPEETIEIFAFMKAADVSKENGGAPVKIADVIAAAKK
ncbi:MAG: Gfo/Idh/MocA family protein [Verrucomicrobiales bacterium]